MKARISLLMAALILALSACSAGVVESTNSAPAAQPAAATAGEPGTSASTLQTAETAVTPVSVEYDSDDLEPSVSRAGMSSIELAGDSITIEGTGATVDGSVVTITSAGEYSISGALDDGQIVVDTQDEQTVYLHYRKCQDMESAPFRDLVAEMFGFIDTHEVSRLAIDLRHNGGGYSEHIKPLFEELAKRPALDREGHFFVIIGRGTYSSAVLNAVEFASQTNAVFVGEPPSSVSNHYGQVESFILPNSRIRVDYSTKRFPMTKFAAGEGLCLADWLGVLGYSSARFPFDDVGLEPFVPDVLVQPTIDHYLVGRDPALDAILDY